MNVHPERNATRDSPFATLAGWIYENRDKLIVLMMLTFIISLATLTIAKPVYEWDLLAYMANAMNLNQALSFSDLHENVYRAAIAGIPPEDYARLIESSSRLTLSQDVEAFSQTIVFFYDSRIIYIWIMSGLLAMGIEPVLAFYSFSTLCVVLSYLLLAKLIPVPVPMGVHIVLPFIILAFGLMYVARLATPDALASLFTIALYFLLLRNKIYWLLLLFPLVVFIRTDLILLLGIFYIYFLLSNRVPRLFIVLSGVVTAGAYLLINNFIVEGDPWSSLIGYNFGEKPTHPIDFIFPVTPTDYFKYLWEGIFSFSYTPMVFVFIVFSVTGSILLTAQYVRSSGEIRMTQLQKDLLFLFISGVAYFVLHFLLFPVSWLRFFAAQYTLCVCVVCWCLFSMQSAQHKNPHKGLGFLQPR